MIKDHRSSGSSIAKEDEQPFSPIPYVPLQGPSSGLSTILGHQGAKAAYKKMSRPLPRKETCAADEVCSSHQRRVRCGAVQYGTAR